MGIKSMRNILLGIGAAALLAACTSSAGVSVVEEIENRWSIDSVRKDYAQQIVTDNVRAGRVAIRFESRYGDRLPRDKLGHYHNELSAYHQFKAKMGQDYWYGLSMFIPADFPIHKNRLVLGQWHSIRDPGEIPRSPPLSQRYENGWFLVKVCHGAKKIYTENPCPKKKVIYRDRNLKLGVWHDFIYHVRWSYRDDGFVELWIDGKKVVDYRGPVGYNDDKGPYFKYGIYRNDVEETYVVYFDEYRRGNSYEEVDPAGNHYGQ